MPMARKDKIIIMVSQFAGAKANNIIKGIRAILIILLIKKITKMY